MSPSDGPAAGGNTVTISGSGFSGATGVSFGSTAASFTVVSDSDTQIMATAPAHAPGIVDVTVTGPAGTSPTSAVDKYVYHAPAATGGSSPGANFVATGHDMDLHCAFGSAAECDYFARAAGFVLNGSTKPVLILDKGSNEAVTAFTGRFADHPFVELDPSLPAFAALTAADFEQFGALIVASDASCGGCDLNPSGGTEDSDAILAQKANIATAFNAGMGILALSGACHGSGAGSGCTNPNRYYEFVPVPVGGAAVSEPFTVTSAGLTTFKFPDATTANTDANCCATHNSFSVPGAGSGLQVAETDSAGLAETLLAANATISSGGGGFTGGGTAPPPTVTGVSPSSGPAGGGTTVTITGTNLTGATAVNFGPSTSTSFTVDSSGGSITAITPPGSPGTVFVSVTTPSGTSPASGGGMFTYVAAPTVTGVSPGSGPTGGGTTVTITGTGLSGASAVKFGATAASSFTVNPAGTSITASAPAGSAGVVDITVTTPGGTSAAGGADLFTYVPAPTVTGVSPSSGPTAGGTTVTITGTGLSGASAVKFGATAASSFTVNLAGTSITASAPAGSAGTVDITVTTPGGTSAAGGGDRFTYQAPPAASAPSVTGVSPGSGPAGGGTPVTITGTGFTGATAVTFGTAAATAVSVVNATTITATSPAGSPGTVDVTVTGPGGTSATAGADRFTYSAGGTPPPPSPAITTNASATPQTSSTETLGASVNPNGVATSAHYEYGLDPSLRTTPGPLYDQRTPDQPLGSGTVPVPVTAGLTGLIPHALYHARLVLTSSAGTTFGPELTFTTLGDPAPPPPVLGQSADVLPISGQVFIKPPSGDTLYGAADHSAQANITKGSGFVVLTEARQIPSGSQIDARAGTLQLVTATSGTGKLTKTQAGIFGGGLFSNSQSASGATKGLTTLTLLENAFPGAPGYKQCPAGKIAKALDARAAKSNPILQTLHSRDNHGKFRVKGRYSAGTVRGTVWDTADECGGTLTVVHVGIVFVLDFGKGRTVAVHAGHRYLATAPTRHHKHKKK